MAYAANCNRPETRSDFLLRKGREACVLADSTDCSQERHRLMLEAESCWWQSVIALQLSAYR